MRNLNKFILVPLLLSSVSAVQVVQTQTVEPAKKGFFDFSFLSFLKSPLFWGVVAGLIVLALIVVGIIFLINWLVKFIKQNNDIFYKLKKDREVLAKTHSRYPSNHWWKIEKNTPIRMVTKDFQNKLVVSKPLAFHRGDYQSHEGNIILSVNFVGKKKWFIYPEKDLIIIPNKEKIKIVQRGEKGEIKETTEVTLPTAKDIIQFNENEILLFAEGFSQVGLFHIPVLKDKEGKIIDLSLPIYNSLKEVVLGNYMYSLNSEFIHLSKEAMNINPQIRGINKTADSNQNLDIQPQTI